ncbi:unnamed protein product [Protopolystoma xenopodis]|uniref:Uncharacterized protein n=1 Tax=Protopolystoma xenopodis TaxID=117903 RepID=A0A3S5A011_9PLAT|nr:unnamed protein product [Protopolystoma xenopodis]
MRRGVTGQKPQSREDAKTGLKVKCHRTAEACLDFRLCIGLISELFMVHGSSCRGGLHLPQSQARTSLTAGAHSTCTRRYIYVSYPMAAISHVSILQSSGECHREEDTWTRITRLRGTVTLTP